MKIKRAATTLAAVALVGFGIIQTQTDFTEVANPTVKKIQLFTRTSSSATSEPTPDQLKRETESHFKGRPADLVSSMHVERRPARMSAAVLAMAASGSTDNVDVIVSYQDLPSPQNLLAMDAHVLRTFPALGMATLRVPAFAITELSLQDGISLIALDEPVESGSASARATANLPDPDSALYPGVASNVRVAVLDTGVADHFDLNVGSRMDCTAGVTGDTRTYRDNFNVRSFENDDGSHIFKNQWIELGEHDGQNLGRVSITQHNGLCLEGALSNMK